MPQTALAVTKKINKLEGGGIDFITLQDTTLMQIYRLKARQFTNAYGNAIFSINEDLPFPW